MDLVFINFRYLRESSLIVMQVDTSGITNIPPGFFSGEIWYSFYTEVTAGGRSEDHSWVPSDHLFRTRKCLCVVLLFKNGQVLLFVFSRAFKGLGFFFWLAFLFGWFWLFWVFFIRIYSDWNTICSQRFLEMSPRILCMDTSQMKTSSSSLCGQGMEPICLFQRT